VSVDDGEGGWNQGLCLAMKSAISLLLIKTALKI
jgi:hypothetical protein